MLQLTVQHVLMNFDTIFLRQKPNFSSQRVIHKINKRCTEKPNARHQNPEQEIYLTIQHRTSTKKLYTYILCIMNAYWKKVTTISRDEVKEQTRKSLRKMVLVNKCRKFCAWFINLSDYTTLFTVIRRTSLHNIWCPLISADIQKSVYGKVREFGR